jgi:PKHD-type hydroxylase
MLAEVPKMFCDLAVADFLKAEPIDAGVKKEQTIIDYEIRNTTIRFVPESHWMTGIMYHIGMQANKFHNWDFNVNSFQQIQYAEYEVDHHYDWHIDTFILSGNPIDRKITVVCLLNDPEEFEGGEFELKEGAVPLKKGSAIAFPAFYQHRVTPVTKGIRRSATLWITGPAFK